MGKQPAFQFYPGDWRRDTQVQMASMETRGVWFEMLCCMWDAPERGKLEGTIERLSCLLGCTQDELERALKEITELKIGNVTCHADVTKSHNACHAVVTVINRRMSRDETIRKQARFRKQRQRSRAPVTQNVLGDVTLYSSSSSSLSSMVSLNSSEAVTSNNGHVPHQEILALWRELMPDKPQPKAWPAERQALLRSRWHEDQKRQCLEYWERLFRFIRGSPFLMGEEQSPGRKPFVITLPWLLKKGNFLNTIEKKYHE